MTGRRFALRVVASSMLAVGAFALPQEQDPEVETTPRALDHSDDAAVHEEMGRLADRIVRGMRATDELLWDATDSGGVEEVSVGERLAAARAGAERAVEDIDELIRIAWHDGKPPEEPGGS